jgi:uncharacterized membrane protein YhhN
MKRVKIEYLASHSGNVFPIVQSIQGVQNKHVIGAVAFGVHHIVFQHIRCGHQKDLAWLSPGDDLAFAFYFRKLGLCLILGGLGRVFFFILFIPGRVFDFIFAGGFLFL